MNESMLTGESIPAIKNSIPITSEVYDRVKDAKYTLYGGTKVV
jgi:magnesium-transporting ATPase (P-type)